MTIRFKIWKTFRQDTRKGQFLFLPEHLKKTHLSFRHLQRSKIKLYYIITKAPYLVKRDSNISFIAATSSPPLDNTCIVLSSRKCQYVEHTTTKPLTQFLVLAFKFAYTFFTLSMWVVSRMLYNTKQYPGHKECCNLYHVIGEPPDEKSSPKRNLFEWNSSKNIRLWFRKRPKLYLNL